jgi:hypothetical protein
MVAFVVALTLSLHGDGIANTFTFDTDKIPALQTGASYGKLVHADPTVTDVFGFPIHCTTSLPGGNKITLTCDVPFPDQDLLIRFSALRFQP